MSEEEKMNYSGQLSLNERCNSLRKNIKTTGVLNVKPDTFELLDKCPDELYKRILRERLSKLSYP